MLWNAKNGEVSLGDTKMNYVSFGHGAHKLVILPGLSDGLATVRGKALLLAAGPYAPYFDRFTVHMFSRIPGSEPYVYPGLSHAAYEEAPDFKERVFNFLDNAP